MRPCSCENIKEGVYTIDQCRLCWLYHNDSYYHQQWENEHGLNSQPKFRKIGARKPCNCKKSDDEDINDKPSKWLNYFDKVVLINLARRPDRLENVNKEIDAKGWCFKDIEVFEAIDGSKVPTPYGWEQGGGAWGCMQSHRHVLERAIMDGVKSILVLEDDLILAKNFLSGMNDFLENVDEDWDQLMIGGQHIQNPKEVKPGIVKCFNCQRTHAYAVRGKFMRELYATFCSPNSKVHCDWIMGSLQSNFKVYAPDPFLIGQSESYSDICGRVNPTKFWIPPSGKETIVLLNCPKDLLPELRRNGVHTGHQRNSEDIDTGVAEAFSEKDPVPKLSKWAQDVMWEVKSDESMIAAACWHPDAKLHHIRKCWEGPVYHVSGNTVDEIISKIKSCIYKIKIL